MAGMRTSVAAAVILLMLVAGCEAPDAKPTSSTTSTSAPLSQWIDRPVTIQFRRDLLGTSRELPVGPDTSSINGAETSISGTLVEAHEDSVVIQRDERLHWVPRETILHIRIDK